MNQANQSRSLWQIFRAPLLIAAISIIGLVAALTGDGWYDLLSWLTLSVPPAVMLWGIVRKRGDDPA